eukprot:scaffold112_cov282-Prasinococcus_capsulatus_cf.AAC.2
MLCTRHSGPPRADIRPGGGQPPPPCRCGGTPATAASRPPPRLHARTHAGVHADRLVDGRMVGWID